MKEIIKSIREKIKKMKYSLNITDITEEDILSKVKYFKNNV